MTLVQKTVYENTDISLFHVDDGWEVTFVHDSLNSFVELEYSAYLENYISLRDTNNWLSIGFTGKVYPETGSVFKAKVHTSEKEFLSIIAENNSIVNMEGPFELQDINMVLGNATVCNGFKVSAESCYIHLVDGSQMLGVQYSGTNCTVSASKESSCNGYFHVEETFKAEVHISSRLIVFGGSIFSASIEVKDTGFINMAQAEVKDMSVYLAEASEATVNVSETMSGFLVSASTLYYKGHPQIDIDCSEDSQLIPF